MAKAIKPKTKKKTEKIVTALPEKVVTLKELDSIGIEADLNHIKEL